MRCFDINLLGYLDGKVSDEAKNHIDGCVKCREELEKLKQFTGVITTHYARGKSLERELDARLASIDMTAIKQLPTEVQKRVDALKESSLTDKIKKIVGEKSRNVKDMVDSMLSPQMQALPASPKDIVKTVNKKSQTKKKP